MPRLIFKAADALRVARHSLAHEQKEIPDWETANEANKWTPRRSVPEKATVVLVHDQGVYLMSNGKLLEGQTPATAGMVAYAWGCDPNRDPEWWDNARAMVGGDDFAEYVPWAAEIATQCASGATEIAIEVSAKSLELLPPAPKRRRK